jgi:archaellum component FlaF (FlaF/FlaG flagellin family)
MSKSLLLISTVCVFTILYRTWFKNDNDHKKYDSRLNELNFRIKQLESDLTSIKTPITDATARLTREYSIIDSVIDTDDLQRMQNAKNGNLNVSQYEI